MAEKNQQRKEKDRRRAFRHTACVPIGVSIDSSKPSPSLLRNISEGGLSFSVHKPLSPGTIVVITVPSVSRDFTFKTNVVWCHPSGRGVNKVGVAFLREDKDFNIRLVERIDRDRARILEKGRRLTFEDATDEWLKKFAKIFPA